MLDTTHPLETMVIEAYDALGISERQRKSINTYLQLIRNRDEETWEHSCRVGLKGKEVAEFTHIVEPKGMFYPCLLHDVGKALTDPRSLKKKKNFGDSDRRELKRHPVDGYRILRGIHDFSARVLLYHHWFSEQGYPAQIPHPEIDWSKGSEVLIMMCARMLSVLDYHDAATYRKNDRFVQGISEVPDPDRVRQALLRDIPDQRYFIEELYKAGIF